MNATRERCVRLVSHLTYRISTLFCMAPWFDFKKQELKWPRLNKAYASVYIVLFISLGISAVVLGRNELRKNINYNKIEEILFAVNMAIYIFLVVITTLRSSIMHADKWQFCLKKWYELDKMMNSKASGDITFFYQFIIGHALFIGFFVYSSFIFDDDDFDSITSLVIFVSLCICEYYCFLGTMCSLQVSSDINRKFKELELLLVSQVKNLSQELNGYSEEMIVRHIMKIGKLYRMISSIVESQNDIFGGVIMLMIWHSLVQILRCVNFLLLNWDDEQRWNVYVCLLTIFSMVETVLIILCCDKTSSSGAKIEKTCYKLQDRFSLDSRPRKEFLLLANVIRSHKPVFTAANYFVINRAVSDLIVTTGFGDNYALETCELVLFSIDNLVFGFILIMLNVGCMTTKRSKWRFLLNNLSAANDISDGKKFSRNYYILMGIGFFNSIYSFASFISSMPIKFDMVLVMIVVAETFRQVYCFMNIMLTCYISVIIKQKYIDLNRFFSKSVEMHIFEVLVKMEMLVQADMEMEDKYKLLKQVGLGHVIFIVAVSLTAYYLLNVEEGLSYYLHVFSDTQQEYYCFLSLIITCNFARRIKILYQALSNRLQKCICDSTAWIANLDAHLPVRISNLGKNYRTICQLTELYNDIFGWVIIMIYANAVTKMSSREFPLVYTTMAILETLKNKRASHRIFSATCQLSQFLCIQPWYDKEKNEFKWPLGYQLYSLFFGFGVISGLGVVLYRSERNTVNRVDEVLTILNTTMLVLLVAVLVLGSNLNRYSWKFLLTEIGNLTSALVEEAETTHILDEFYLQFYFGHVIFVGTVIFVTYFVQYDHILSIYCLLTEYVVEYYCFIATTIISNYIILTKWKYRNIVKALDDIDVKADDLDKTLSQIVDVGHSCKVMSELVECCNRIQGWQVLWLLGRAVLQLLRSVNWLLAVGDDFKWPSFLAIVLNAFIGLVYSLVYGILLILGLTYVSYKSERTSLNKVDSILEGINTTILIFLVAVLVLGTNVNRSSWKLLLTEIRDFTLSLVEDKEAVPILDEFYLQVFVGHVIFIGTSTFMSCFAKFSDKSYIVMEYIPEYYCLMATTINSNFLMIAKWKYRHIVCSLESCISDTCQPGKIVEDILSIRQKYLGVSELVDCFNKLQGWQNLWIFARSVVQLLRSVNWLMHVGDDFTWSSFLAIVASAGVVLGESAYIILCCESATAAGNKVEKTCHKLQENFELTSKAREELFRLAEITKSFAPKFTAANFFVINKGTILGIINIATTYLIVIIQFNDSVKHKSTAVKTHE
nr:unnamed protein product [Callosobruchus chinensis]